MPRPGWHPDLRLQVCGRSQPRTQPPALRALGKQRALNLVPTAPQAGAVPERLAVMDMYQWGQICAKYWSLSRTLLSYTAQPLVSQQFSNNNQVCFAIPTWEEQEGTGNNCLNLLGTATCPRPNAVSGTRSCHCIPLNAWPGKSSRSAEGFISAWGITHLGRSDCSPDMIKGHDSSQKVLITAQKEEERGAAKLHLIWEGSEEQIEEPSP